MRDKRDGDPGVVDESGRQESRVFKRSIGGGAGAAITIEMGGDENLRGTSKDY